MKKLLITGLFALSFFSASAQYPSFINAHYLQGFILPHRKGMEELQKNIVQGTELEFGLQMNENKSWHVSYHQPLTGGGIHYANLGNRHLLGYATGIYGFIEIPLKRWEKAEINYRLTSGLTYVSEKYNEKDNPENIAISTSVNYLFNTGFRMRYWLTEQTGMSIGTGFTHYSNGAVNIPNKGLNQGDFYLGLTHYLNGGYYPYENKGRPVKWNKSHEFYALGVSGWTDVDKGYSDQDHPHKNSGTNNAYLTAGLSLGWNYRYAPQRKAGISLDGFFNESINWSVFNDKFYDRNLNFWQKSRIGIGLNHEFFFNRLVLLICGGVYIKQIPDLDRVTINEANEWAYEKLGFRYYVTNNLFANVSVKAYGFLAQTIGFGIGYSVNSFHAK